MILPNFFTSDSLRIGPNKYEQILTKQQNKMIDSNILHLDNKNELFKELYFNEALKIKLRETLSIENVKDLLLEYSKKDGVSFVYPLRAIIQYPLHNLFGYELTDTFSCFCFPENSAWFSVHNDHYRYNSKNKDNQIYFLDFVDILQIIHHQTILDIIHSILPKPFEQFTLYKKQLNQYNDLSDYTTHLKKVQSLYYFLYEKHFEQANLTYHIFPEQNIHFILNLEEASKRLNLAQSTISKHLQVLMNYQVIKRIPYKELSINQQFLISFYNKNQTITNKILYCYQLIELTEEKTKEILNLEDLIEVEKLSFSMLGQPVDFTIIEEPAKKIETIRRSIKKKLFKKSHLTEKEILQTLKKNPKLYNFYKKNKKFFRVFDNILFKQPTKQEIEFFQLKNKEFIFIHRKITKK